MILEGRTLDFVFGVFLDSMAYWMNTITFQINVLTRHLKSLLKIKSTSSFVVYLCGLIVHTHVLDLRLFMTRVLIIIYNKMRWEMQPRSLKNLPEGCK